MVKLADTQDLGSCTVVCRFKSCHPHQKSNSIGCCFFMHIRDFCNIVAPTQKRGEPCHTRLTFAFCE